jgi:hypothetical protein
MCMDPVSPCEQNDPGGNAVIYDTVQRKVDSLFFLMRYKTLYIYIYTV